MKLNLGMDLDEYSAKKVLGIQDQTMMSMGNCNQFSFLGNGQRMKHTDLKYITKEEIEKNKFELTENESKLQKMLKIEHNTIDLINENMKLKEMIIFIKSNFAADMGEKEKEIATKDEKINNIEKKVKIFQEEKSTNLKESEEAEKALEKKQQDYTELYNLLIEREKELTEANKYAESLLDEKKKYLAIIDGKDREIEQLGKDLYHRDKQFEQMRDDLDRQILVLQNEKKTMADLSQQQNNQILSLNTENARLLNELAKMEMDFKTNWNNEIKADLSTKVHELDLKDQEINDLKDQLEDLQNRLNQINKENDTLVKDLEEKETASGPKEEFLKEINAANQKNKDLQQEINDLNNKLANKKLEMEHQDDEIMDLNEKLKKAHEENEEQDNFMKEHFEKLNLNETEKKKLQRLLEDETGNLQNLKDEIDLVKIEKEKNKVRIKQQEDELMNKMRVIEQKDKDIKNLDGEIDFCKDKIQDLEKENDFLKRENSKYGENMLDEIEDYKNQLANKNDSLKDYENQLKDLSDDYNNLTDDFNKLNDKFTEDKKKLKSLQDNADLLTEELNKNKTQNNNLKLDLDQKEKDLLLKNLEIEDLKKQLMNRAEDDKAKNKIDELTRVYNTNFKNLTLKIAENKNLIQQLLDTLEGTHAADYAADEAIVKNTSDDQMYNLALKFILDTDHIHKEINDEVMTLKGTIRNLQNEKIKLLEKTQDLEEKYSDLRTRHDNKTDMVGKLSVKAFVLMSEIEKLTKMINSK